MKYKSKDIKVKAVEFDGSNIRELIELVGEVFEVLSPRANNIETKVYARIGKERIPLNKGDRVVIAKGKWFVMNHKIFNELFEVV